MNIFFLSRSPKEAAERHCDKHVVKMILESTQLLYSAHWILNPDLLPVGAYKKTHVNHPSAIWIRESLSNYLWLCSLAWYLCKEYQFRYGLHKVHKCETHILWLLEHPPIEIPRIGLTMPPQAMPDQYKQPNPVDGYQLYYIEDKAKRRGIVNYTRREWPQFLIKTFNNGYNL
jgi:hypothetical protein